MKILATGDFVIWQRKRICRIVREPPPREFYKPPLRQTEVKPAGLTHEDWVGILNDTSRWIVQDDNSGEEFEASGYDLHYINEMQVIAVMSRIRDSQPSATGLDGQKEEE